MLSEFLVRSLLTSASEKTLVTTVNDLTFSASNSQREVSHAQGQAGSMYISTV